MTWTQIEVFASTAGIDLLCAVLEEIGVAGFVIQDPADFEQFVAGKQGKWDLIDESLLGLQSGESSVTFYLPENEQGRAQRAEVEQTLARLKKLDTSGQWGRLEFALTRTEQESWQDSWKQFWKPTEVGKKLVVCTSWEEYKPKPGQTVICLDPGMAFGTGTHDSTRLCMELAEQVVTGGERVLDLGCGSGILAITALMLGADHALGIDVDQVAVSSAGENAALNEVSARAFFRKGNLTDGVDGCYDIIFANIVADVILRLVPDIPRILAPGGVFIASGIIQERAQEVEEALNATWLRVKTKRESGGWVALAAGK